MKGAHCIGFVDGLSRWYPAGHWGMLGGFLGVQIGRGGLGLGWWGIAVHFWVIWRVLVAVGWIRLKLRWGSLVIPVIY